MNEQIDLNKLSDTVKYLLIETFQADIKKANYAYRTSEPLDISELNTITQNFLRLKSGELTDKLYDSIVEELRRIDPNNAIFKSGIIETEDEMVSSERKVNLARPMYSLDKETSIPGVKSWAKRNGLNDDTILVITGKYDGVSCLRQEKTEVSTSRGDGVVGQDITEHYKSTRTYQNHTVSLDFYTIGELIIRKDIFKANQHLMIKESDGKPYKNGRNMVAGMVNKDKVSQYWQYIDHIRYGVADEEYLYDKLEQLQLIEKETGFQCPYEVLFLSELTEEKLNELYYKWGSDYEIDGLVIDINSKKIRENLGRGTNNNPAYAIAYKANWTPPVATPVQKNVYDVSKEGYIKPVVNVEPFDIEGVTISRATGYNARFILNNNIGEGAIVEIIRSGSVIPKIVNVVKPSEHPDNLPEFCPCCNSKLEWNKTGVELMCRNPKCSTKNIKKIAFFFETLGMEYFGEAIVTKFYWNGYDSISKILQMSEKDIAMMDGMGSSSANKIITQFEEKVKQSTFDKLAHASGYFENLGSRKIKMIVDGLGGEDAYEEFKSIFLSDGITPKLINKLNKISGVSDITAIAFMNGIVDFDEFLSETGLTYKKKVIKSNNLKGRAFVFTGVRDDSLEEFIIENGGEVKGSVSKNTTDVIVKDLNSGSSKITKARELGVNIIKIDDFRTQMGL